MTLTFVSNFLNHHQLPLCTELREKLGDNFQFIATEPVHEERLRMGYHDMNREHDFCICSYENNKARQSALHLAESSDVVVIGSASEIFVSERIARDKLTFRYAEHYFKGGKYGFWRLLDPRVQRSMYLQHRKYKRKRLYMLCASCHTARDYAMFGAYKGKTFRWGYFPEVPELDIDRILRDRASDRAEILWCGRFLDWKHPERAIQTAQALKKRGLPFQMTMIGNGPMYGRIEEIIKAKGLEEAVRLVGVMAPEEVRRQMERAHIYLLTSDRGEGWGAVLNEAMSSGCAVIADHRIGSVGYLVHPNKNGLIYRSPGQLISNTAELVADPDFRDRVGRSAYSTMHRLWTPRVAAERLICLSEALLKGQEVTQMFPDGPCSTIR